MGLPNWLSLFRLCLVPVFPLVLFSSLPGARYLAVGVYLLAALTDIIDGYVARKYNMITRLGRILDPLADKAMSATVLVCVAWMWTDSPPDPVSWWLWGAVAVYFIKEGLMGIGAIVMYRKVSDVNPSSFPGKFSVTLFVVACTVLLLFPGLSGGWALMLIGLATASSVYALFHYLLAYIRSTKRQGTY